MIDLQEIINWVNENIKKKREMFKLLCQMHGLNYIHLKWFACYGSMKTGDYVSELLL